MSMLTNIANVVKTIGAKITKDRDKITPVSLAVYVDAATKFLSALDAAVTDPQTKRIINTYLDGKSHHKAPYNADRVSYLEMSRSLDTVYRSKADHDPADWMHNGLEKAVLCLNEIRDKITSFVPPEGYDLKSQMTVSTVLLMGFIDQSIQYGEWIQHILDHAIAMTTKDGSVSPKYTFAFVSDMAQPVGRFYSALAVGTKNSVITDILKLRGSARDVDVADDQSAAANYLTDGTFSKWEQSTADGVIRNPISMYYTMKETYRLNRIDMLRNRINWLKERMSALSMKNMGTDPKSPEYKTAQTAIAYYSNLVTDYDRKILALS